MKSETLTLYNTLSGKKELFEIPRRPVKLFVCGPTVYDKSHIGHARTYIFFDVFVRYLKHIGASVYYLQNITDIDDKIIRRADEMRMDARALALMFTKQHIADMKRIGVKSVTRYAPATHEIKTIVKQVQTLIEKGYAYQIEGDGWYFDVSKFAEYGKLSHRTAVSAEDSVSRIDEGVNKKNRADFCIWKFKREGEPSWRAPFGEGRPGWHIEDTSISEKYFGPQYGLHGGGLDLKFPHHEAEIAQQEAASGKKPFVKIWMHVGMLTVKGEKMAKSVGNFITIEDFLKKHSAQTLRWIVLTHHYRSPLDYTDTLAKEAVSALQTIEEFIAKTSLLKRADTMTAITERIHEASDTFHAALQDDVNTPEALAAIFSLINDLNTKIFTLGKTDGREIARWIKGSLGILGIFITLPRLPFRVKRLAKQRELFRIHKQFIQADEMRTQMDALGYTVEDTPLGPLVLRKM
jgi:cysteinyl-tRNA synthetase